MEGLKEAMELLMVHGRIEVKENEAGDPFLISASGSVHSLEEFFPPRRIKQVVNLSEVGSFVEYVNRYMTTDTLIFASVSETGARFTAILDYHGIDLKPAYCAHQAVFTLMATPDWKAWVGMHRQALGQVKFATWLEDYQHLFTEPSGAEFLELVRNLFGKKDAQFNSSVRLDNGAYSVGYAETIEVQARTTQGAINLPAQLIAEVQVFEGMEKQEIRARLKTRVEDRKLALFFETIQLEQVVRGCILAAVQEIAQKTKIVPLLGQTL